MKIKILYQNKPTYLKVPDEDYSLMLDIDYEMRTVEAPEDKKKEVTRCDTVQEMFDLMNKKEYNNWHKFDRHHGISQKPFCRDDQVLGKIDDMDYFPDKSEEEARVKQAEYESICEMIRKTLKKKQADLLIALVLDGVSVTDYAKREGVTVSAVSHRRETAIKNFKKHFKKSSTFSSSQGYKVEGNQ